MDGLETKNCIPCAAGAAPLEENEEREFLTQLHGWSLHRKGVHQLRKLYQFPEFRQAIDFVTMIAEVAESEGHHPDIYIAYRHVTVILWTKKAGGLTENDFILAAKLDALPLPG